MVSEKVKTAGMMNDVERFIRLFDNDQKFINGLCYWFAYILKGRFPEGEMWYDQIENHFYFVINNEAYDVRGKIQLPKTAMRWCDYEGFDFLDYNRVIKYCILKED
jgi:hypothetical protein